MTSFHTYLERQDAITFIRAISVDADESADSIQSKKAALLSTIHHRLMNMLETDEWNIISHPKVEILISLERQDVDDSVNLYLRARVDLVKQEFQTFISTP